MKKLLLAFVLLFLQLAVGQVTNSCNGQPCAAITASGGTLVIPNIYGGMNGSFEELLAGSPASSSITIQGCMRGGTCDTAFDTNATNAASAIRSVVPTTKPYSYFLVTATWSGGTNVSVSVNPFVTSARAGGSLGAVASVFTRTGAVVATSGDYTCAQVTNCGSNSFPITVAGTVTSGGIPYFSGTTTETSSALLAANGVVLGGGAGGAPTVTTADATTTHALFATAGAPAFRAIAAGDLPGTLTSGTAITNAALTNPTLGVPASGTITNLTGTCTNCNANNSAQVNTNTYPAAGGFTSGGVPFFSSTTAEGSSALLAANGVVLGGGAGVAPATNTSLTFSAGTLNVGTTGTTGVININGTTAGVAAPITTGAAGLTVIFPTGTTTNPGINFVSNNSNTGFIGNSTGGINFVSSGTATALFGANGVATGTGNTYAFNRTGTRELGIGDGTAATGAAVLTIDSTTIGNEGGLLRNANICRITADVSLTVNVANSFCSFSLPGAAKAWGVECNLLWTISAGSGTNTFALGVNASQTPTAATNVGATILTTQTGTQTQGTVALSASGATSILTSPTYTPAATLQVAQVYGTVLASAAAGTFAVTATAAGTTATAAIKAGSVCSLL